MFNSKKIPKINNLKHANPRSSGGKGIIKGTGSLLKHTVKGTFNSVSKITNSFATDLQF